MDLNFKILLISKILEGYLTEMFDYYFIETPFVVHLKFCGDTRGTYIPFPPR